MLVVCAACLIAAGACTEVPGVEETPEVIELTFTASWASDGPETRTSLQDHGNVYWNPGDAIKVFRGSLSGRFESTLTTAASTSEFTGRLTTAPGTTDFNFSGPYWAVYPYAESTTFSGSALTLDLPGVQTAQPWTFDGNLNPAIGVSDDMELTFFNVCGLFCFSVQGEGFYAASLRGNNDEVLAGTLSVEVDNSIPSVTGVQDGVTSIMLNAPEGETFEPATLYYFVVIPQTFSQGVTLTLYKEGETGEVTRNVEIVLARSSTVGIAFADVDSTYTVVEGGDYVFYPSGLASVTLQDGTVAYDLPLNGAAATTADIPFVSYKEVGGEQVPVSLRVDGFAADNGGVPGTFSSEVPEGFSGFSVAEVSGSWTGTASVPARMGGVVTASFDAVAVHAAALAANGDNGFSSAAPQDLSLYDINNLGSPRSSGQHVTANCYVVDRAGWYMFPIVYGNAVDGTRAGNKNGCNVTAYDDGTGKSNPAVRYVFHTFQRADGELIGSPYILSDMGLSASDVEAVIVWEDVAASSPLVYASDVEVISAQGSFLNPDGSAASVPYVKFKVDGSNIRQGNVLIAVRRKSDSVILWSWHIWITDADMNTVTVRSRSNVVPSNEMLRDNLGWCETTSGESVSYGAEAWFVKVSQVEGDADPVVIRISRSARVIDPYMTGSGTLYQFGRKDPLLPNNGSVNKTAFSPAGYTITAGDSGIPYKTNPSSTVKSATQNPHVMYVSESMWMYGDSKNHCDRWNLWNMFEDKPTLSTDETGVGTDYKVTKTVYDPCPPGFCVPNYMAYDIFSNTGENFYGSYDAINAEDRNGDGKLTLDDYENGWYFYTSLDHADGETIFFPATRYRDPDTGTIGGSINGFYRTAKPKGTRYNTTMAILTGPYGMGASRATGFAVRPVAEQD